MKIIPKNLFQSKKNRSVSKSNQSSFTSYTTTSSGSPESSHNNRNLESKSSGVVTPTSVLPTQKISASSEDWSEISTHVQFDLLQAFKFIDIDGDGKITTQELEEILYRILGSDPPIREELTLMLSEIDKNGDGIITLEEFSAISSVFGPPACDNELRDVFDVFDTDHDGRITAEELFAVFKSLLGHERCSLEECISMIRNVDKNGDGFVCFEDFTRMMEYQQR